MKNNIIFLLSNLTDNNRNKRFKLDKRSKVLQQKISIALTFQVHPLALQVLEHHLDLIYAEGAVAVKVVLGEEHLDLHIREVTPVCTTLHCNSLLYQRF